MKYLHNLYLISLGCLLLGCGIYAYMQSWFIVYLPYTIAKQHSFTPAYAAHKKTVHLYWYASQAWHTEQFHFLQTSTHASLQVLINAWLMCLEDEGIIDHEARVESACISIEHQLLLSVTNDICNKQMSLYEKQMLIQGLCKTLHAYDSSITSIRFFVHEKQMIDPHIDFSVPWIITTS